MIWIIILGLIAGYRETQIHCMIGNWYYEHFRKWFWFTNQANKRTSIWDSFHVSVGVYALLLCISLATCTTVIIASLDIISFSLIDFINIALIFDKWVQSFLGQFLGKFTIYAYILILWVLYMYGRNLSMHVILPLKPDWRYLIPLVGTWFKKAQ